MTKYELYAATSHFLRVYIRISVLGKSRRRHFYFWSSQDRVKSPFFPSYKRLTNDEEGSTLMREKERGRDEKEERGERERDRQTERGEREE